ncbi:MAG: hypothetical protein KF723_16775 [Rhizobiaceae bacterium]|nr:hypothetical protein [Rhizobiaceae bacterium]
METGLKSYICQYESGGTVHSCRIEALSAEDALARMRALPWGVGAGPVGLPRRHHPQLERVTSYAVACLRQMRQLMGDHAAGADVGGAELRTAAATPRMASGMKATKSQ